MSEERHVTIIPQSFGGTLNKNTINQSLETSVIRDNDFFTERRKATSKQPSTMEKWSKKGMSLNNDRVIHEPKDLALLAKK
mmetsp:Transcript_35131/g.34157  ORF Transcript_35131/g.34157 Transcript_35131/m.34157 type:complete len:81 (+) Transcript_35131:544-786(+)